jgi:tetratricopeptide (TPR) repeat protein
MKLRAALLAVACLAAAPFVMAQAPGSLESDLKYGREYMASGNYAGAATYFRQAAMLNPNSAEAHLLLAVALQRAGKTDEARPFFNKAISLSPAFMQDPQVQRFAQTLGGPSTPQPLIPASPGPAPVAGGGSVASEDAPIGSAGYLLHYAARHLRDGNFTGAADYANQALAKEPGNAQALSILADARARRAPDDAPAAVRAHGGDPNQIGTPAYFTRYARHHLDSGAYASAVSYARQALAVDPAYAPAQRILAQASGKADKNQHPPGSCEAIYSSCWSGAMTYTPGSGYAADNLRRQQCMVERNICQGARR